MEFVHSDSSSLYPFFHFSPFSSLFALSFPIRSVCPPQTTLGFLDRQINRQVDIALRSTPFFPSLFLSFPSWFAGEGRGTISKLYFIRAIWTGCADTWCRDFGMPKASCVARIIGRQFFASKFLMISAGGWRGRGWYTVAIVKRTRRRLSNAIFYLMASAVIA